MEQSEQIWKLAKCFSFLDDSRKFAKVLRKPLQGPLACRRLLLGVETAQKFSIF